MSDREELANAVCFSSALRCNHQWLGSAYSKEIAAQIFALAKPNQLAKARLHASTSNAASKNALRLLDYSFAACTALVRNLTHKKIQKSLSNGVTT